MFVVQIMAYVFEPIYVISIHHFTVKKSFTTLFLKVHFFKLSSVCRNNQNTLKIILETADNQFRLNLKSHCRIAGGNEADVRVSRTDLHSSDYHIIAADLTDTASLETKLTTDCGVVRRF